MVIVSDLVLLDIKSPPTPFYFIIRCKRGFTYFLKTGLYAVLYGLKLIFKIFTESSFKFWFKYLY